MRLKSKVERECEGWFNIFCNAAGTHLLAMSVVKFSSLGKQRTFK